MCNISRTVMVLCTVSAVMSASLSTESLTASINEVQKKFSAATADKRIIDASVQKPEVSENKITESNEKEKSLAKTADSSSKSKEKIRNDKMLDFFRYFAPAPAAAPSYPMPYMPYYNPYYQQPYMSALYSPYYSGSLIDPTQNPDEYDEEYQDQDSVNEVESDDDGSRANKRRPGATKNSPIFYIRLPPTPYMYIPGMGYISQPPTIQPLTPQYPVNPFINLPITYLSNAKPTGVFPWSQQSPSNFATPQFPSYLPPRPQKPYRPKPQIAPVSPISPISSIPQTPTPTQDSKITHLGSYLFNGRPESIYLMPPYNPYASPYHLPNPYQAPAPLPPSPYNPYSPIYAPPALPTYY